MSKTEWYIIGKGGYNLVWYSAQPFAYPVGGKKQKWVFKQLIPGANDITSKPDRAVRVFNEINSYSHPVAFVYEKGWVLPYYGSSGASDQQSAKALAEIYRKSKRIVVDACGKGNMLFHKKKVVCVDTDLGLKRGSLVSHAYWKEHKEDFPAYWDEHHKTSPLTVETIKALKYLEDSNTIVTDHLINMVRDNPKFRSILADHYQPAVNVETAGLQTILTGFSIQLHEVDNVLTRINEFKKSQQAAHPKKFDSIESFCQRITEKLSTHSSVETAELSQILVSATKKHFLHEHKILRALADIVFIPLGLASLGGLFALKARVTGACLFSTTMTRRGEEALKAILPARNFPSPAITC